MASVTQLGYLGLTVSNVEFFIDGTKVGEAMSFPYRYIWSNPAVGNHVLTARLTDSSAATLDSAPVNIRVTFSSRGGVQLAEAGKAAGENPLKPSSDARQCFLFFETLGEHRFGAASEG